MKNMIALFAGVIFGIGLLLSGMTNPAKVIGFLDITGSWDISLALVMGGALAIAVVGFGIAKKWVKNNKTSATGDPIELPTITKITPKLLIGAVLFGVGWGLVGICPGPALVMLGTGSWQAMVFVVAMLVGMFGFEWFQKLTPSEFLLKR